MANNVKILDGFGSGDVSHVHRFGTGRHSGLLTLSERFYTFDADFIPFLNDTLGTDMAQDITFGGTQLNATVIHAGVNSGSGASGTTNSDADGELKDSGASFDSTVGPGALVHNTTDGTFAIVQSVANLILTLTPNVLDGANIMDNAEDYVINDIWVGTAVAGTWNFADSTKITITSANNNDEATFTVDSSHIWLMTDFKALTGKVDLDTFDGALHTIVLEFGLNGTLVGNTVNLNDFINTGNFAEQTFVIPKADLGLTTQNVNSMRITISRSGGAKPTIKFDDFQFENSGTPAVFKATTSVDAFFEVNEIVITLADNITGITTVAGATETATVPNIAYDDFMGITSPLTNGVLFLRSAAGKISFNKNIKQIGDFLATGLVITNHISDGTNTFISLSIKFPEPVVLDGSKLDFLSFTINDDLSGLLEFTALVRGSLRKGPLGDKLKV